MSASYVSNCCNCGRIVDTREKIDGCDDFGAELNDGRWTCSMECWVAVVDPETNEAIDKKLAGVIRKLHALYNAFNMRGANATTMLRAINTLSTMQNKLTPPNP